MINLLSIDTSTKKLSLVVSRGEKILKYRNTTLNRPLSQLIIPGIREILERSKMPLAQLDGFAIGLGPGSFTSLRVGLSTIKGLIFAVPKPVVGIPSLDLLAMNVQEDHCQICALCDARRNLVYACLYEKRGTVLKRKSEYLLTDIQSIIKRIRGEVTFTGDGFALYQDDIKKAKGISPRFTGQKSMYPQARVLAHLALQRFAQQKYDNIDRLVPLYLYPDHCQIKGT